MRWLILALPLSGCTLVLSETPCDTASSGTTTVTDSADTATPIVTAATLGAGSFHTCAIEDGTLRCWGADSGLGVTSAPDGDFQAVSAGHLHTCATYIDGRMVCFGDDSEGQRTPPELGSVSILAAGGAHTCALEPGVGVACWGRDTEGQSSPPDSVATATSLQALASGWLWSCAQPASEAAPTCWGHDDRGQVSGSPTSRVTTLALGNGFGTALSPAGDLLCWGDATVCEQVSATGAPYVELAAGRDFVCARELASTVTCWGAPDSPVLDTTADLTDLVSISASAGGQHACGIRQETAEVVCWGADVLGQASPQ